MLCTILILSVLGVTNGFDGLMTGDLKEFNWMTVNGWAKEGNFYVYINSKYQVVQNWVQGEFQNWTSKLLPIQLKLTKLIHSLLLVSLCFPVAEYEKEDGMDMKQPYNLKRRLNIQYFKRYP